MSYKIEVVEYIMQKLYFRMDLVDKSKQIIQNIYSVDDLVFNKPEMIKNYDDINQDFSQAIEAIKTLIHVNKDLNEELIHLSKQIESLLSNNQLLNGKLEYKENYLRDLDHQQGRLIKANIDKDITLKEYEIIINKVTKENHMLIEDNNRIKLDIDNLKFQMKIKEQKDEISFRNNQDWNQGNQVGIKHEDMWDQRGQLNQEIKDINFRPIQTNNNKTYHNNQLNQNIQISQSKNSKDSILKETNTIEKIGREIENEDNNENTAIKLQGDSEKYASLYNIIIDKIIKNQDILHTMEELFGTDFYSNLTKNLYSYDDLIMFSNTIIRITDIISKQEQIIAETTKKKQISVSMNSVKSPSSTNKASYNPSRASPTKKSVLSNKREQEHTLNTLNTYYNNNLQTQIFQTENENPSQSNQLTTVIEKNEPTSISYKLNTSINKKPLKKEIMQLDSPINYNNNHLNNQNQYNNQQINFTEPNQSKNYAASNQRSLTYYSNNNIRKDRDDSKEQVIIKGGFEFEKCLRGYEKVENTRTQLKTLADNITAEQYPKFRNKSKSTERKVFKNYTSQYGKLFSEGYATKKDDIKVRKVDNNKNIKIEDETDDVDQN